MDKIELATKMTNWNYAVAKIRVSENLPCVIKSLQEENINLCKLCGFRNYGFIIAFWKVYFRILYTFRKDLSSAIFIGFSG